MNIAIVDDLEYDRSYVAGLIKEYSEKRMMKFDIFFFESGEKFIDEFKAGFFDIILLDIYMQRLTGIETAKRINSLDPNNRIVFLTTSNGFACESYDVGALYYLKKPVDGDKLFFVLDKCTEAVHNAEQHINITSNRTDIALSIKDIIYVDVSKGRVMVHLARGIIKADGRYYELSDVLLRDKQFLECYKGITVNMKHIVKTVENDFVMDNGERLPIRKREKKKILQAYMEYTFNNM